MSRPKIAYRCLGGTKFTGIDFLYHSTTKQVVYLELSFIFFSISEVSTNRNGHKDGARLHHASSKGARTAQAPPHRIHTTPVPTKGKPNLDVDASSIWL